MGFSMLLVLLLAFTHSSNAESPVEKEDSAILNWIENILLFPCCVTEEDKTPLDELAEATNDMSISVPDPLEQCDGVANSLLETLYEMIEQAKEAIIALVDKVSQQCGQLVDYTWELIIHIFEQSKAVLDILLDRSVYVRDLLQESVNEAIRVAVEAFNSIPCEWALAENTLLHKFKAVADMFLGDINWYMFATLLSFAVILIIQLIRRKMTAARQRRHTTQAMNQRLTAFQNRRSIMAVADSPAISKDIQKSRTKTSNSPGIPVTQPVNRSPDLHSYSPSKQTEKQKNTRANLNSPVKTKANLETSGGSKGSSSPKQTTPSPGHRIVELTKRPSSEIHVATDTDDLMAPSPKDKHSPKHAENRSTASPVWIRYGSSPSRREPEDARGRRASPLWIRRVSVGDECVQSYIQRDSPLRQRYVPSPIQSLEADIGDPCCSSSFIEECLTESEERGRRDSGDSLLHDQKFRPSVITKRYAKLKEDEFDLSHASSNDSVLLNVSDMNKSIALYSGDGNVFYELVFFYTFKNIFHRLRDMVTWSQDSRRRRHFL